MGNLSTYHLTFEPPREKNDIAKIIYDRPLRNNSIMKTFSRKGSADI